MSEMDDLNRINQLRAKYPHVMWVSGKNRKLPRQNGRVVVKVKYEVGHGNMQAKVYPGLYRGTEWLTIPALDGQIEWALKNCHGDPRAPVRRAPGPVRVATEQGLELVKRSGGRAQRVNSRFFRVSWDPGPKCWLRFSNTSVSRVKRWTADDKDKLFYEGLYAWVVQFGDNELVRLKYSFTTFATEWVHSDPVSFKNLIDSAQNYADSRDWRRMELG